MNNRCIHILMHILSKDRPVKLSELQEAYRVSERTVRYDLDNIGYWLKKQKLGSLEAIYSEGITISCTQEDKKRIFELFDGKVPNDYYYSPEERQKIILLELLNTEQPVKILVLQKKLNVSRGTVIKELALVEDWLSKYKLSLIRKPNYGLEIQGEEAAKRSALLGVANDFMTTEQILAMIKQQESKPPGYNHPYKKYGICQDKMLFDIDLELLEKLLNDLQELFGVKLGDNAFVNLFTHLAVALQRIKAGKRIFIPADELLLLEDTAEFQTATAFAKLLEENFNIPIPKSEIGYITLHILGMQLQKPSEAAPDAGGGITATELLSKDSGMDYFRMAKDITYLVKKQLNAEFLDDHQLLIDLSIHLRPAAHRCRYNMPLENPLLNDIKHRYSRVFHVVKEALLMLRVKYPFDFNDHEISYIVTHFAAEIEKEKVRYRRQLNILLVCASGVGTAKILYNRLNSNFRDLNIVDTVSYLDYFKREDWDADLVISTIDIKSSKLPYIVVTPLLTEADIVKIEEYLLTNTAKAGRDSGSPAEAGEASSILGLNPHKTLRDVLTASTIRLDVSAGDWEEAFCAGADLLLRQGLIEPRYITALIDTVRSFGPYAAIAPGIALSHAKPEDGVNGLGLSFIRLSKPVSIGHPENDPIRLVFTLAPVDSYSHHKILAQLMKIFLNKKDMDIFLHSGSLEEILSCAAYV